MIQKISQTMKVLNHLFQHEKRKEAKKDLDPVKSTQRIKNTKKKAVIKAVNTKKTKTRIKIKKKRKIKIKIRLKTKIKIKIKM